MATVKYYGTYRGRPDSLNVDESNVDSVAKLKDLGYSPGAPADAITHRPEPNAFAAANPNYNRDLLTHALPWVAGAIPSLLLPELTIPAIIAKIIAAGGMGTAAEFAGQGIRGEPVNPTAALLNGGLPQGLAQLAGDIPAAGASRFAGAPERMAGKALVHPGMQPGDAQAFLNQGIRIGPTGLMQGEDAARAAIQASHDAEIAHAAAATGGATKLRSAIADEAKAKIVGDMGKAMKPDQLAELNALNSAARTEQMTPGGPLNANGQPITSGPFAGPAVEKPMSVSDVLKFKQQYDKQLIDMYERQRAGQPIQTTSMQELFDKEQADAARRFLRDDANAPGLGRQMQNTQEIIRIKPAIRNIELGSPPPQVNPITNPFGAARNALDEPSGLANRALDLRGAAGLARKAVPVLQAAPHVGGGVLDELLRYLQQGSQQTAPRPDVL